MRFGCRCISGWSSCPRGCNCSIVWGLLLTWVGFCPPQYVGSFTVEDVELQQQAGQLEEQLRALKVGHLPLLPLAGKQGDPQMGGDTPRRHSSDLANAASLLARTAPGGGRWC